MTNEITDSTTPNSQSTAVKPSRRQFLRTAAIGAVLGLAGCLSAGSETGEATPTAEREAIEDISFEGEHLVLTATEEFRGTELHVVDPTETVWAKTETEPTTGKARIRLLDVDGVGEDNHYSPGMFRFVFEPRGEDPHTERVDLVPDISVVGVEQFQEEIPLGFGRIAIEFQNSGTGPTWVSDITYEEAPNYAANDDLSENTYPALYGIEDVTEAIIYPESTEIFLSRRVPLRFLTESDHDCSPSEFSMTLIASTPNANPLRYRIEGSKGGKPESVSLIDAYVCSDVQVKLAHNGSQ
ncbi:twin-arginine translocation signal domain-containing protein [Halomicroarcula sp. F13]|uniref:Twin-arginine translocation signal domain-containing protein n=1 Tax=Haloarcula rubra TaxID=2487747 RepID=A0AAW4Q0Q1_9EURY|nr:twin-arginine translocation signal domain-containing protein [Halomicroarcula rubra]MBX0326037.1 twin-arginine translocation signal domain-containing protein [Halomicroarcula rubra]